jgi:hypothetical protein
MSLLLINFYWAGSRRGEAGISGETVNCIVPFGWRMIATSVGNSISSSYSPNNVNR